MKQAAFDPQRIAYLEQAGWKAYYDRSWPQVLFLMVQMDPRAVLHAAAHGDRGAIDIVRASIAFAPVDNDISAATAQLKSFYEKARSAHGLQTDAETLAALEMDYWVVHRQLAVARKQAPDHAGDITPMVEALAKLHAALFAAPPAAINRSAELRAEAAATVDPDHRRLFDRYRRRLAANRTAAGPCIRVPLLAKHRAASSPPAASILPAPR